MDFTPLIAQVWTTFAWFIPLMILIGLLKSPLGKGYVGELLVRLFAHWQLDRQTYQRLHSVIIFVGGSTFKTAMPAKVTEGIGFIRYIKSFQQPIFSDAQVAMNRGHIKNFQRRNDPTTYSNTRNTVMRWKFTK